MPANLVISPATLADTGTILHLIRQLADYEHLSHEVCATEPLLAEHLFGRDRAAEALIARLDGEPVGFALYFTTFSTFVGRPGIWLEDIFVLPRHRRHGIGRVLLRQVAAIAVARNCGRLEWSVLDWNEPALRFYQKIGATPMSDWTIQRMTGDALRKLAESSEPPHPGV
ncbi:MAG TPA: GNAT family N-acetyltransferase [Tepidisphaeraceae bacterium]|nr:GNAT family N-acetyltransferase [Tepidisphaeraceae bacterium]